MSAFRDPVASQHPHNHTLHIQVKEIADKLRPDLVRLHGHPTDKNGDLKLYQALIQELKGIKKQVTNHDTLFSLHNAINHLQKAIQLAESSALNEEILWHLQEVMALLFKVQNLPS